MSTLRVDNLQASDGLSPAFTTDGIAKAGLVFDQVAVNVDNSFNVASVDDNATGDFDLNFTNNMSDTLYYVSGMGGDTTSFSAAGLNSNRTYNTTDVKFGNLNGATVSDRDRPTGLVFGDLA